MTNGNSRVGVSREKTLLQVLVEEMGVKDEVSSLSWSGGY